MTSGSMDGDPRLRRGSQSSVRDGIAMVIGAIVVAGALLLGGQAPASTAPEGPTATAPANVVTTPALIFRMRLFRKSATYTTPVGATATFTGPLNCA